MRGLGSFFLCICLWGAFYFESADATILGFDDRVSVDISTTPYNRVFHLSTGCTAALVGPSLLLTAAHCVSHEMVSMDGKISLFEEKSIEVLDGNSPDPLAYGVSALIGTFRADEFYDYDWAFVKIDQPLGNKRGFFKIEHLLNTAPEWGDKNLVLPGFPGDRPNVGELADIGCSAVLYYSGAEVFRSDCDGWGGNSGSPFLIKKGDDWIVVGLFIKANREQTDEVNPYLGNMGILASKFLPKLEEAIKLLMSGS